MKRHIVSILPLLGVVTTSAQAEYVTLEAAGPAPGRMPFTVVFNDANNDGQLTIDEFYSLTYTDVFGTQYDVLRQIATGVPIPPFGGRQYTMVPNKYDDPAPLANGDWCSQDTWWCFSGPGSRIEQASFAGWQIYEVSRVAETPPDAPPDPAALVFNPAGVGHILIVPYFSTQSGNATLLNLYNTDTTNAKAVKVRFRGASNSDDIYDFQVFLSPGDVWTADIRQAASGLSRLVTSDKSCTVPASVNGEFITSRLNTALAASELANETREGYVEILNMGDIQSTGAGSALYTTVKHVNGVAPCVRSILDNLVITDSRISAPTTGLMANWTIINVPNTTVWSGEAAAVEGRSGAAPVAGVNVYWPQRADAVTATPLSNYTADPLFLAGAVDIAQYDLPDLSTPYFGAGAAITQANALSAALAATSVAGEFLSSATISASTDWVVAKPTRRYYVAVDYSALPDSDALVTNIVDNSIAAAVYYTETNTSLGNSTNGGKPYQACTQVTSVAFWNREEGTPAPGGPVISPGVPTAPPSLCGEVSVVGVNSATSPTGANVARVNVTLPSGFADGWGKLTVTNGGLGLPMVIEQFSKATNPSVSPGVSGTFGANYPARILTRGTAP